MTVWIVNEFQAESQIKKYGKVLINEVPDQTTDLLKRLCTDFKPGNRMLIFLTFFQVLILYYIIYGIL